MKIKVGFFKLLQIQGNIATMIAMWPGVRARVRSLAETDQVLNMFVTLVDSTYRIVTGKQTPSA